MSRAFDALLVMVCSAVLTETLFIFDFSFPPKPETKEKLERIHKSLMKFQDNQLEPLSDDFGSETLVREMREMVDAASTKFKRFQDAEAKRRR